MDYCTYAYLREDGTPYYIGKGKKHRPYSRNRKFKPPAKERILILKCNLTEEEAIRHEIYMIAVFGRKDQGTGILHNLTDGGEGTSGYSHTAESKSKIGKSNSRKKRSKKVREKISQSLKGFSWYYRGDVSIQSRVHPGEGWTKGRIKTWGSPTNRGMSWYFRGSEVKMFASNPGEGWQLGRPNAHTPSNPTNRGKKWYNNGQQNRMFVDPPEGWTPGMLRRSHG
jgi:hypothetical protein